MADVGVGGVGPGGLLRREATDEDSPAVIALIAGCFAEYPGCVLDLPGIDAWMQAPSAAYAGSGGRFWVVLDGAVAVASVGFKPVSDEVVELKSLYVAAAARRGGLGRALVALVEDCALALGSGRVELWTDTRFADAHRLYERLGYVRGAVTRYLHDPSMTTEFSFAKDLPAPR